jgi:hypothetical protein
MFQLGKLSNSVHAIGEDVESRAPLCKGSSIQLRDGMQGLVKRLNGLVLSIFVSLG